MVVLFRFTFASFIVASVDFMVYPAASEVCCAASKSALALSTLALVVLYDDSAVSTSALEIIFFANNSCARW